MEGENDDNVGDIPIDPETGLPMTKSKMKKLAKQKNKKPQMSKEEKEKLVSDFVIVSSSL